MLQRIILLEGEKLDDVSSDSVDLITCAQGAHWLDRPKFYEEARDTLKQNAVLCFYGYGIPRLDVEEASKVIFKVRIHVIFILLHWKVWLRLLSNFETNKIV